MRLVYTIHLILMQENCDNIWSCCKNSEHGKALARMDSFLANDNQIIETAKDGESADGSKTNELR